MAFNFFSLAGVILIFAAIFGGVIKSRWLELPALTGSVGRSVAGVVGLMFLGIGLFDGVENIKKFVSQTSATHSPSDTNIALESRVQDSPAPSNPLSGKWIDDKGTLYTIVQEGESVYWSSDGRDPMKSMRAEGTLHGNTLSMITETNDNSTGHAEMTVSATHDELTGMLDDSRHGKGAIRLRRR